jgi:hypothetical protein
MKSSDPLRFAGIILALALSLGLAGCSAVKLGYNNLPELLYWWLDGYADFSDPQEAAVRAELARLQAWHRRSELPRFVDILGRVEQVVPGEITPEQACAVVADVQARMEAAADAVGPAVGAVAAGFSEDQLRHMQRKFTRNNEKFRRDFITASPEDATERRYEQMLVRLELVYGRLDDAQRAVLRDGIARSGYDASRILADRERRQQDLVQTLRRVNGSPPEQARTQLRAWLQRAMHAPDPGYRSWQEGLVQEGCRVFSVVHRGTTPVQRDHAVQRLRGWQRDLRELEAQAR